MELAVPVPVDMEAVSFSLVDVDLISSCPRRILDRSCSVGGDFVTCVRYVLYRLLAAFGTVIRDEINRRWFT